MARIRSIHPEQWTDDDFVTCSALARLLALGLRNQSDDNGIFERNPIKLKMRILPADNCDVPALLEELRQSNQVLFFTAEGREFGIVRSFQRFQKPKSPSFIHPVPSEPLPKGYALSKWYSGNPSEMKDASATPDSTDMEEGGGNRVAGGEERSRREGKEPKTPQAQAATKVGAPRAHDPREDALRSLFAAERVSLNGKGLLHVAQWAKEGVTLEQLTDAITMAREHKPDPQLIPAAYLAPIVADLRAGKVSPPAKDTQATIKAAIALTAAQDAKKLADSEKGKNRAPRPEPTYVPGDDAWWKPTTGGEEALTYMGPELGVVAIAGQPIEEYRLRAIAAAGPGPWREGLTREEAQQVRVYEIEGWNPPAPVQPRSMNVRRAS